VVRVLHAARDVAAVFEDQGEESDCYLLDMGVRWQTAADRLQWMDVGNTSPMNNRRTGCQPVGNCTAKDQDLAPGE